jgi:hypothetical protein
MASITFWGNVGGFSQEPSGINHGAGSGLGFYGNGYGISVPVNRYQDSTFVTNANGTATNQYALNNTKWMAANSGQTSLAGTVRLSGIPNYQAPLNIRFTHDESVAVQNCKIRIFDRNNIEKQASGVVTQVYEVRHPNASETKPALYRASPSTTHVWTEFDPTEVGTVPELILTNSPGLSGLNTDTVDTLSEIDGTRNWLTKEGAAHRSVRHDWYVALSASPITIGSKTNYGLYFTCEYL